jgi:hypothetical protein
MNRVSIIAIWVAVIMVSAFGLYRVKYEVQSIRAQIRETSAELAQERESLHVVAAEWAYLNRPERLQRLAEKYLNTDPTNEHLNVSQVAEVEAIPFPQIMQASADFEDENHITPISYRKDSAKP